MMLGRGVCNVSLHCIDRSIQSAECLLLLLLGFYLQDLLTLSDPLTGNLQELLGKVKRLAATLLAAPPGTQGQLLQEVTGASGSAAQAAPDLLQLLAAALLC